MPLRGADESLPAEPGEILAGKYRVERVIGRGGMGVVVAAMHLELQQRVALKLLLPHLAQPDHVARFFREARAAARISSEHVARVHDVSSHRDTPYIVMEHLEGSDLGRILDAGGAQPIGQTVDRVLEACEAIAEAHALGIVHRDLKPPNLFVARRPDGSETVKILDFGISKAARQPSDPKDAGSLTRPSDVFGSPLYMSPEQLRSSTNVDHRTDIWSLGVILYELLTSVPPFAGSVAEVYAGVLDRTPAPLRSKRPDAPQGLEDVVMRCLAKERSARYSSVAELARALAPFGSPAAQRSIERIERWPAPTGDGESPLERVTKPLAREDDQIPAPLVRAEAPTVRGKFLAQPIPEAPPDAAPGLAPPRGTTTAWQAEGRRVGTAQARTGIVITIVACAAVLAGIAISRLSGLPGSAAPAMPAAAESAAATAVEPRPAASVAASPTPSSLGEPPPAARDRPTAAVPPRGLPRPPQVGLPPSAAVPPPASAAVSPTPTARPRGAFDDRE